MTDTRDATAVIEEQAARIAELEKRVADDNAYREQCEQAARDEMARKTREVRSD